MWCHTTCNLCFKNEIKESIDADVEKGIIEPVPIGETIKWCVQVPIGETIKWCVQIIVSFYHYDITRVLYSTKANSNSVRCSQLWRLITIALLHQSIFLSGGS